LTGRKEINFEDQRFARVTRAVLKDEKHLKRPTEKLVYAVLCMYADNNTTKSHPSVRTIAKNACCSENSARSALRRLEELGLVGITRRKKGKENFSNEYVLWEPAKEFLEGTSN
jgi:hypothetical protein